MYLPDENREKLLRIMERLDISGRRLAKEGAGYRTHTYMAELLRGDEDTLDTAPALGIVEFLNRKIVEKGANELKRIAVEDLFLVEREAEAAPSRRLRLPSPTSKTGRSVQRRKAS